MKKATIIIMSIITILLMISCASSKSQTARNIPPEPATNMPPEIEVPKAPKTVSPLPKIVSMDELTLIGFEKEFDGETMTEIPDLWTKLMQSYDQIQNRANHTDAWGTSYNMQYGGDSFSFTYFAGYEVTDTTNVPEGMVVHVVPPSKYARFTHYGSLNNLTQTYSYIYGGWMPQSGYKEGTGNELEFYGQKFNPNGDDSEMFIFVPIQ